MLNFQWWNKGNTSVHRYQILELQLHIAGADVVLEYHREAFYKLEGHIMKKGRSFRSNFNIVEEMSNCILLFNMWRFVHIPFMILQG
jgi:hypothetical protein